MTYKESKKDVLALIEELDENSALLTDDPDISAKIIGVFNNIQFELARLKKIPRYMEIPVEAGAVLTFRDISEACGREIYQLAKVSGIDYDSRAENTVLKVKESGTAEIDCFVYPNRITEENQDEYEMELSEDALGVLPYGVAADLLKSDKSTNYGATYKQRYEEMLQRLDYRYATEGIRVEGGVDI
jgi:hypothetical protein